MVPRRGLNSPHMTGKEPAAERWWPFAVQLQDRVLVALSDAHRKPPFPVSKETDFTSTSNISVSSAVPALEGVCGSLLGAPGGCHLAPSHGNSFFFMISGQNATLLGRPLRCLQLL